MNNEQLPQSGDSENVQLPSEPHRTWRSRRALAFAGVLVVVAGVLVACGGGGGSNSGSSSGSAAPATYTIGGTVSGLSGSGLVLQNNTGNDLAVSTNGTFTFSTALASGAAYAATVKTQPSSATEGQTCVVSSGSGTVATNNVSTVAVTCTTTTINGIAVPPEPLAATNNATLAGVDVNTNGVRDDVERIIAQQFGGTADFAFAMAYARVYQGEVANPTPTNRHDALVLAAQEFCAAEGASAAVHNFPMGDTVLNTPARQAAIRALNDVLVSFSSLELRGLAACLN